MKDHHLYGTSTLWKKSTKTISKNLDEAAFDVWLWKEKVPLGNGKLPRLLGSVLGTILGPVSGNRLEPVQEAARSLLSCYVRALFAASRQRNRSKREASKY
jgi:hypothetical protein